MLALLLTAGCSASGQPPIRTEPAVDLQRFMGDWYVIAAIPTWAERGAHNAVETYALNEDGTVATTFTFRKNGFDGAAKTLHARGFVRDDSSNAVWGMQFLWPFKADYRIVYLDDHYETTVIGRNQRDYVWIMARAPQISDQDYAALVALLRDEGYDTAQLVQIPQSWPGPAGVESP